MSRRPKIIRSTALHAILGITFSLAVAFASFPASPPRSVASRAEDNRPSTTQDPVIGLQSLFQGDHRLPETEARPGIEEDTEGRSDWFTFQRSYPSNSIPSDARLKAWQQTSRIEIDSFVPQASSTWRPIGPSPTESAWLGAWGMTSGRVNSIAVSPVNANLVIIGSSTGGIWRSTDGGDSFIPVSDDQVDLAVGSIAFSKSNPSIAYAGMGDTKLGYLGSGVLKSTDEGISWQRVSNSSLPSPAAISKIEIDPANPNRIYAAQYAMVSGNKLTSSGVFFSTDGGVNWTRTLAGAARDLVIHPGSSNVIYAGLSRIEKDTDPAFGLYRSTNSGSTWSMLFSAQYDVTKRRDIRVAVSPADPQKVYVYYGGFINNFIDAHIKASTDGGATWTEGSVASVDLGQLGYNSYLFADPRDAMTLYLGSRDVYRSADGGVSWTNVTWNFYDSGVGFSYAPGGSKTHTDQHALAFSPASSNEFYLGNDGGVSKTTDGGTSFRSLNTTLTLSQFVGLALHPTNSKISYGGTQDNGAQQRLADSSRWREISAGDGGRAVIDAVDPSIVFLTYVRGDIYRFAGDGAVFEAVVGYNGVFGEPVDGARIGFYPPFTGNGVDSTLYFGSWRLFMSADRGNSWFAPAGFLDLTKGINANGSDILTAIAVARGNTNVIYTGSLQGRAMMSSNAGRSWTDITSGLPNRSITAIAVDPSDSKTAYLCVSGFNTSHVFRTTNSGASWSDISGGLPDIPVNALLIDPASSNTIYAGSDVGVFRSTTRGDSWRSFNRGLPPVVIHEFAANSSGVIQAATYGRGVYELGANVPPSITSASFDGRKRLTITGTAFDESPTVLINEQDKSDRISSSSDNEVVVAGKAKKLKLKSGDNTIQIVTSGGLRSNIVVVTLQ
ncbi:MAG TPA: IPT/TIG domain-containing protein [Blastocatellia bacterium]|nr:IPT/TIG domain-containing protein [Blastocatellia bacterium]